jgi:hypothetical protein
MSFKNKYVLSISESAYDDKRFVLENGINTLAWGHYKTNIEKDNFPNCLK